jgi:succinate dehydrogenase flavin-adding protein (antitoxin of CptAB toxin-antitoxin module)
MSGIIRFYDKEVYAIQLNDYTRSQLIIFFLNNHFQSIITVYNENHWVGSICYRDILRYEKLEQAICRDMVFLDESVFKKAHEILEWDIHQILPVFNHSGELDCFCYLDEKTGEEADSLMNLEKAIDKSIWIQDIYPDIKTVWIHGMNEYAYRFYLLCKRKNIHICLWDEKWKLLDDFEKVKNDNEAEYPDYAVLKIYAEGTGRSLQESFGIFGILAIENIRKIQLDFIDRLNKLNIEWASIIVPDNKSILYFTEQERAVIEANLSVSNLLDENRTQLSTEELEKLYQIYDEKDIEVLNGRKTKFGMDIYLEKTEKLKSSKKRIYVQGPGIIRGFGNRPVNTLLSQMQIIIDAYIPNEYCVIGITTVSSDFEKMSLEFEHLAICEEDVFIFLNREVFFDQEMLKHRNVWYLESLYNQKGRKTMFGDCPIHTNAYGNYIIAKFVLEKLKESEIIKNDTTHHV